MRIRWWTLGYYVAGFAVIGAALLAGCSAQPAHSEEPPGPFFETKYQLLPDGRTVLCLYKEERLSGHSGGAMPTMSCDWDNIAPSR